MKPLRVKGLVYFLCYTSSLLLPHNTLAEEDTQPSMELLEFLADWEQDQGEWMDPLQMQPLARNEHTEEPTEVKAND